MANPLPSPDGGTRPSSSQRFQVLAGAAPSDWVDDAVELFFLAIQGSGQILLPDGTRMRVGYADQNGHPFRSLGGALIRRGQIRAERASMQGIKEWARRHPLKIQAFMNVNPSYVFFNLYPLFAAKLFRH